MGVEFIAWIEGRSSCSWQRCRQCVKGFSFLYCFVVLHWLVECEIGESVLCHVCEGERERVESWFGCFCLYYLSKTKTKTKKLSFLSLEVVFGCSVIRLVCLDAFFCLYLGWIGNRGWPKGF